MYAFVLLLLCFALRCFVLLCFALLLSLYAPYLVFFVLPPPPTRQGDKTTYTPLPLMGGGEGGQPCYSFSDNCFYFDKNREQREDGSGLGKGREGRARGRAGPGRHNGEGGEGKGTRKEGQARPGSDIVLSLLFFEKDGRARPHHTRHYPHYPGRLRSPKGNP